MEGMNILPAGIVFETYKILSEGSELILVEVVPYRLQVLQSEEFVSNQCRHCCNFSHDL
jgi:hypothetical protein